jgi:hypothetical protein
MQEEHLKKIYQERRLIKELIRLDNSRYSHLEARSKEIKIEINSEYFPFAHGYFMMYDSMLAQRITMIGIENLKELLKEQE